MFKYSQLIETYKMLGQVAMVSGGGEYKVSWAMSLLEQGVESDSLAMLATMLKPFNEFEVDDYFNTVLSELGIIRPDRDSEVLGYVKVLMGEVIEGNLKPEEAVTMIYAANVELDYPGSLGEFTALEDEWYCEHINGWSKQKRNEEIIKACKEAYDILEFPNIAKA